MPKREDEFWAGMKEPRGRGLCPFCGTSDISYNPIFKSWKCKKEHVFPVPSYGPGKDFGKEARWLGKTTSSVRRKEYTEGARKRGEQRSRAIPNWMLTFLVVFPLLMLGVTVWALWGAQISGFLASPPASSLPAVAESPPESPSAEFSASTPTPLSIEPAPVPTLKPAKPAPAPTVSPTPVKPLSYQYEELLQYALELINQDREANGLSPVTLGDNPAAQKHAEEMLANRYLSHWDMEGMKPYMRYTLAGGVNYEAENGFVTETIWIGGRDPSYRRDPRQMLKQAQEDLMTSLGHRKNILDKWHKRVNLGIAYDEESLYLVQQFEGDYVEFSEAPAISGDILTMSGKVSIGTMENISIHYDPLPQPLTPEQLNLPPYDYAYGLGEKIGIILPPPAPGYSYINLPPNSILATTWDTESDGSFIVEANIGPLLERGEGVYTVVIWTSVGDEFVAVTNYSLFIR